VAFADRNKVFGGGDGAQWFSVDEARCEITKGRIPMSTLSPTVPMTRVNPVGNLLPLFTT